MKSVCILSRSLARELIRQGERVTDIKPNRDNRNQTVVVFKESINLRQKLNEWQQKNLKKGVV